MSWVVSVHLISPALPSHALKSFQPLRRFILNMINYYLNCLLDGSSLIISMLVLEKFKTCEVIQKWMKIHLTFRP